MTRRSRIILSLAAGLVATAATAYAQEPVSSIDALAGRIQAGQRIWVTDATGREVRGTLERLSSDTLVLKAPENLITVAASDVRRIRARDRDSPKNGTLIGLAIGGGMGTAWCIGAVADDSGDIDPGVECAEGFTVFPALGALMGLAVDAAIPGKMRVVYQGPLPQETPRAGLIVVPSFSSRTIRLTAVYVF